MLEDMAESIGMVASRRRGRRSRWLGRYYCLASCFGRAIITQKIEW